MHSLINPTLYLYFSGITKVLVLWFIANFDTLMNQPLFLKQISKKWVLVFPLNFRLKPNCLFNFDTFFNYSKTNLPIYLFKNIKAFTSLSDKKPLPPWIPLKLTSIIFFYLKKLHSFFQSNSPLDKTQLQSLWKLLSTSNVIVYYHTTTTITILFETFQQN